MKKELIEFTKEALQHISEIDNAIDEFTEGIKDYTDTAGDLFKPIKAFISIYRLAQKLKFKRFLKAYANNIKAAYDTANKIDESKKLKEYLRNQKNLNFIYESIESAINAKSLHCAAVLGYFSSLILTNQIEIGYKELIALNALQNLNDIELETSLLIFTSITDWTKSQNIKENNNFKGNTFIGEMTIEKLKYLQIIESVGWGIGVDSGPGSFRPYDMTEYFWELLNDSGVSKEI